jgi:phosphate transport system substrate-binding protein
MLRRITIPLLIPLLALGGGAWVTAGAALAGRADSARVAPAKTTPAPGGVLNERTDTKTPAAVTLNGAGANSIEPFFQQVFYNYNKANSQTTVNYSPAGSSVGVADIEQNTVNFGDSEIPMASTDLAKATAGKIIQIPVDLGGVAVSYNLSGVKKGTLKLDGPTLAEIFDGTITNWDDPRIAEVSGLKNLPNLTIVPVHRADSSGPGWDLDAYLIHTARAWVSAIGTSKPSKTWPLPNVGVGEQLNSGVATYIGQTPGAIGYVEYAYAFQSGFSNVALKNAAGKFVLPSVRSIAAAGTNSPKIGAFHFDIIDRPGAGTYPLTNFSWTLVYRKQPNLDTGIALGKLLYYVVTQGQKVSAALGYAPMPAVDVQLAVSGIEQLVTSTGARLFAS